MRSVSVLLGKCSIGVSMNRTYGGDYCALRFGTCIISITIAGNIILCRVLSIWSPKSMYVCMYVHHVYQLNFVGLIDGTLCPDQTRDHPGDIWAQITGVGREFQSADSDLDWKYSASWAQMKSDKLQLMCTPSISRTHRSTWNDRTSNIHDIRYDHHWAVMIFKLDRRSSRVEFIKSANHAAQNDVVLQLKLKCLST